MMLKSIAYFVLSVFLIGLCGCSGSSSASVNCDPVEIEDSEYCTYRKPITETGYDCPAHLPNARQVGGGTVCTDKGSIPEGDKEKLNDHIEHQSDWDLGGGDNLVNQPEECLTTSGAEGASSTPPSELSFGQIAIGDTDNKTLVFRDKNCSSQGLSAQVLEQRWVVGGERQISSPDGFRLEEYPEIGKMIGTDEGESVVIRFVPSAAKSYEEIALLFRTTAGYHRINVSGTGIRAEQDSESGVALCNSDWKCPDSPNTCLQRACTGPAGSLTLSLMTYLEAGEEGDVDLGFQRIISPDGTEYTKESHPGYFSSKPVREPEVREVDLFGLPEEEVVQGDYSIEVHVQEAGDSVEQIDYFLWMSTDSGNKSVFETKGLFKPNAENGTKSIKYSFELENGSEVDSPVDDNDSPSPTIDSGRRCTSDPECEGDCVAFFCTQDSHGRMTVDLTWKSPVDLDLYVFGPEGQIYSMRSDQSGYFTDTVCHDETECPPPYGPNNHLETLTIPRSELKKGDYHFIPFVGADQRLQATSIDYAMRIEVDGESQVVSGTIGGVERADYVSPHYTYNLQNRPSPKAQWVRLHVLEDEPEGSYGGTNDPDGFELDAIYAKNGSNVIEPAKAIVYEERLAYIVGRGPVMESHLSSNSVPSNIGRVVSQSEINQIKSTSRSYRDSQCNVECDSSLPNCSNACGGDSYPRECMRWSGFDGRGMTIDLRKWGAGDQSNSYWKNRGISNASQSALPKVKTLEVKLEEPIPSPDWSIRVERPGGQRVVNQNGQTMTQVCQASGTYTVSIGDSEAKPADNADVATPQFPPEYLLEARPFSRLNSSCEPMVEKPGFHDTETSRRIGISSCQSLEEQFSDISQLSCSSERAQMESQYENILNKTCWNF